MQNGGGGDEAGQNRGHGKTKENPTPFNKLRYKIEKLNYQKQEDDEKESSLDSLKRSSSNSDTSKFASKMKKLKIPPPQDPNSTLSLSSVGPQRVVNFGPFSPSGSSKGQSSDSNISIMRIRVVGSEQVHRQLALRQTTYLRPKPARRPTEKSPDPDPNKRMGPPESRNCKTPYETVKEALTFLKSELRLTTTFHSTETDSTTRLPSDVLSNISPDQEMSIEEVILELDHYVNSIPKSVSSDEMKALLIAFQRKLGIPERPGFYNLMWVSATEFLKHLGDYFVLDNIEDYNDYLITE